MSGWPVRRLAEVRVQDEELPRGVLRVRAVPAADRLGELRAVRGGHERAEGELRGLPRGSPRAQVHQVQEGTRSFSASVTFPPSPLHPDFHYSFSMSPARPPTAPGTCGSCRRIGSLSI